MTAKAGILMVWMCAVVLLLAADANAVPPIVQLPGTDGCVLEDGSAGVCADGVALDASERVIVSPDGRNVYVTNLLSDSVAVFDRDAATGALTQRPGMEGCVSDTGTGGECRPGTELNGAFGITLSTDGRFLYATAVFSNSVLTFVRGMSGSISQLASADGCVSNDGSGGACADGIGLLVPRAVEVSSDGRNVYVVSESSDALLTFDRDIDGVITQKGGGNGCLSDTDLACAFATPLDGARGLALSPDGLNVYVAASVSDGITIFDRDPLTGILTKKPNPAGCINETGVPVVFDTAAPRGITPCQDGVALNQPMDVVVSPDGRNVYAVSALSKAVLVFDRDVTTGELAQKAGTAGCISDDGTGGACVQGVALADPASLAISPDGETVLVAAGGDNAIAVFDRDLSTGALTQKAGVAACVSSSGSGGECVDVVAHLNVQGVAVSPDGRNVYSAMASSDGVGAFGRDALPSYDIDGDGESDPLTDGLLLLRFLFGFSGATLINGVVDLANCTRCTAPVIEAYIEALLQP